MSDSVNMARTARERLSQALAALQQPGVPTQLIGVAEPVAQAMTALHQIESTGGSARAQAAPRALDGVRRALMALQGDASGHPAVISATEAVASSLSLVHGLTASGTAPAVQAPQAARPAPQQGLGGTMPAQAPPMPAQAQRGAPARAPAAAPAMPARGAAPSPPSARGATPAPGYPAAAQQPVAAAPQAARAAPGPVPGPASPVGAGTLRVNAELGVHSATNFYKGLSGNDLFDSGGIFIATYQIPSIGKELIIHVSMPGGYEFDAKGVVRWTREAPLSGPAGLESPPGFGAQFTDISPEGRQLIQRYVRNREPLFHDDL
ncbi:MAG TPA: PilZ domain-containing protein [Polyangiaceae bacterium]|nr:PilZ domain-containing protein [Polyangiaceae bacterium]